MSDINEHVADLVDDYLHALLSPGRAAEVEQHCATCPSCQTALDDARRRRALLQAVPPSEAPSHLIPDTLQRISEHDRKRRRRLTRFFIGSLAALAACALGIIGAQVYFNHLSATPYDLLVLGQHNLLAATNSSLRIRLMDHTTKAALAGVPVVVELRGNGRSAELARFTTDAQGVGQPRFLLPDWPDGDYGLVVTAQTPGAAETISRTVRLTRSWKLMLTSDKPVYQPGQTIHVRTLALRQPDLRPVAKQEAIFTLADPKGNILFKHAGHTSRYGITAADCELAKEIAEGAYTLACKVGDTESRQRIEVRKYVLPKFKVDVQTDRSFYQPKDKAHITVQADYFFGKPVSDAVVEIEVRKGAPPTEVIQRFSVKTDAKGEASIDYAVPDQPLDSSDNRLSFMATVTDSAGQKQARGVERVVTRQPVRIEVLPENGKLVQGVPNIVYLLATRADGTPARVRLQIGGLNEIVNTDANGLASCEVTPSSAGVRWTLVAWDADEKEVVHRNVDLPCGSSGHDFLLRTDRGVYESGQTMRLTADGGGHEPVFVDFLKGDQTLPSETIDMTAGHGSTAFDLPPDLFGTVRLCAYRLDANGVVLSKTRVVYIRPASQLKITPKLDQKEYRPGRRAHLDLTLTDADGKPCPGAISLAGVDEAVFSVLAQRPGTEAMFYTLERQLLQPVYALYPWSPEQKAADGERLEQALFAATVQRSEGRNSSGLHSLSANSLPAKTAEVEREHRQANDRVRLAWMVLVFAGLGLAYFALWCFLRIRTLLLIHGTALVVVVSGTGILFVVALLSIGMGAKDAAPARTDISQMDSAAGSFMSDFNLTNPDLGMDGVQLNYKVDRIEDVSVPGAVNPAAPRVRKAFPETLLWTPQLVTDDDGRAHLDIDLADSITTWRLSASAVAADGRLGAAQLPLKVFQPFFVDLNLPVSLMRNDEVSVPVVVYNYLDKPQTVTLTLKSGPWFALQGDAEQRLDLAPREVRSTTYRLKATKAGTHELQVSASAAGIADALKRRIEVVPDGRRVEHVFNGTLQQSGGATLLVPDNAIEGSVQAFVKIYPSGFSQLVEGLGGIFQMPSGCFEQTSSTTYPNILALDYLRRHNLSAPKVEAKARQYIHLGYQRLVGFEVSGGGFDWFGHPPANRTLTAYGLMEFEDMARVHEVDPQLIARTRRWLLDQRKSDGSWAPEGHAPHDAPAHGGDAKP
ncbi:MAG TPA: alpha-2-macroglobulin family protein, partial [Gemmataceae bacterium]